jgi:myosin heavy subunit
MCYNAEFDGHRLLFGEVIGHPLAGKIAKSSQYQDDDPPKTSLFSWKKSKPRKIQQVQADHQQLIDDSRIIEETLHRQLQDIVRENQEIYQLKEKVEEERQSLVKKCEQQQVLLQKKGQEKEEMAEKVNHQDEQIYKLKKDKAKLVQKVYQQQNLLQKMKEEKEQLLVEIDQKHQRTKEEEAKYELQMLELEELRSTVVSDQNDVESYHEAKLALQERTTELQKMTEHIKAIEKDHRELENELKDIKLAKESLEREAEESKMKEKCLIEDHNKIQRDLHEQLRDIVASTNQTVLSLKEDVNQLQIAKEFNEKQNKELRVKMEELEQINDCLSQQNKELTSSCSWILQEEEIHATNEVLGKGSWGVVKVAIFKRTRVAAKYMNELNISRYNIAIFTREMELLAQVRHPNLVQFLGATRERRPIIITELLTTSLRKAIEKSSLTRPQVIKISLDICNGLNYLHSWRSQPLIHRNLSSTNILLEPTAVDREWRAKISDYISTSLSGPTNITSSSAYCPPEGYNPNEHSPLMDVYSFGVLAMEMILSELPPITVAERDIQATTIRWPLMKRLIQKCISHKKQERPQIFQVIFDLNNITE